MKGEARTPPTMTVPIHCEARKYTIAAQMQPEMAETTTHRYNDLRSWSIIRDGVASGEEYGFWRVMAIPEANVSPV